MIIESVSGSVFNINSIESSEASIPSSEASIPSSEASIPSSGADICLMIDDFTRSNENPLAAPWITFVPNYWSLDGNRAKFNSGGGQVGDTKRQRNSACGDDMYIYGEITRTSGAWAVAIRGQGASAYDTDFDGGYGVYWTGSAVTLRDKNWSTLGSYSISDNAMSIKLQAIGTAIKVFVNGTERISVTNSTTASGAYVGFYGNSGLQYWDNFESGNAA